MKKIICLLVSIAAIYTATAQKDILAGKEGSRFADTVKPNYKTTGKSLSGPATVYDTDLDGTKTASGEIFLNIRLTAASNDFTLNSWVKVTNPKNKKFVILRINDRLSGRQKKKTVISLSQEAASSIGIKKGNALKVKIESIVPQDSVSFITDTNENSFRSEDSLQKKDSFTPNIFATVGKAMTGIASFYSYNLDGSQTSTGERYRNNKLTAASNNFKLNTWVLVTNLRNRKSVIVRINDHMHPRMKKKGRVVDLSREAAKQLDFMDNGLAKVKVQPIAFVFSPVIRNELDSLQQSLNSAQLSTDSVKMEEPFKSSDNFITGIASFYSTNLDGTPTATGETYRNSRMSAASNNFALNTWVRITNIKNNKSVVLRINDRMHPRMQKKGRVVDLSRVAAKKLDFIKNGLTKVKVEIVSKETLE